MLITKVFHSYQYQWFVSPWPSNRLLDLPSSSLNSSSLNGDFNGDNCYMNSSTGYESNNNNPICSTKKRHGISPNRSEIENNVLHDGVGIDVILPEYTLNQYSNMDYNNQHNNLMSNGKISTPNNSPASTLNSSHVISKNGK